VEIPKPKTAREKQIEALFPEFVEMGPNRSYGPLGRKHGIDGPELLRHARAFLWPERINAALKVHNERTSTASDLPKFDDAAVNDTNRLHLSRMIALQKRAMDYLETCTFDKPEAALRCIIDAMKMEREIKGMTKDKTDDLRSVLTEKLNELRKVAAEAPASATPAPPDFAYDPQMPVEELPPDSDGPEGNPPPPSGGDSAQ
jgi:hypothetical protein